MFQSQPCCIQLIFMQRGNGLARYTNFFALRYSQGQRTAKKESSWPNSQFSGAGWYRYIILVTIAMFMNGCLLDGEPRKYINWAWELAHSSSPFNFLDERDTITYHISASSSLSYGEPLLSKVLLQWVSFYHSPFDVTASAPVDENAQIAKLKSNCLWRLFQPSPVLSSLLCRSFFSILSVSLQPYLHLYIFTTSLRYWP